MRYFSNRNGNFRRLKAGVDTPTTFQQKKANIVFAFVRVVGPDGLEPPTYAL